MDRNWVTALDRAAKLVGDRWSLVILGVLVESPLRYGELQEAIPEISTNVLAQRLVALEAAGLIMAEPYSRRPPRMRYSATAAAQELVAPLAGLAEWGRRHHAEVDPTLRHDVCGTPLELSWRCPVCDVEVADPQLGEADGEPSVYLA